MNFRNNISRILFFRNSHKNPEITPPNHSEIHSEFSQDSPEITKKTVFQRF